MRAIKVAIADEDEGFRDALVDVLAADPRFSLTGVAATAEGIVSVVAATHPDLVLLDVRASADDAVAARTVAWLSQSSLPGAAVPAPRTVVMSTQAKPTTVRNLLNAGARGFLLKGRIDAHLAEVLVSCAGGEVVLMLPDGTSMDFDPESGASVHRAADQVGDGASAWSVARSCRQ